MAYPGTDVQLVEAAVRGDDAALDRLVDESLPHVLDWCARLGGNPADVEDAAHDVMVILVTRIDALRSPEAFPYWLFGTTRNVLRNRRRKAWLRRWLPIPVPDQPDPRPGADWQVEANQTSRRVHQLLARLPATQREVLVLCDLEERSTREASLLLGIPQGTVKSRLRLARARFVRMAEQSDLVADLNPARQELA